MRLKSKLEALSQSVLPYLREQFSSAMGEPIEVMLVVMDPRGDAMALCGLPDEFQYAMLDGLLKQKGGDLAIKQLKL